MNSIKVIVFLISAMVFGTGCGKTNFSQLLGANAAFESNSEDGQERSEKEESQEQESEQKESAENDESDKEEHSGEEDVAKVLLPGSAIYCTGSFSKEANEEVGAINANIEISRDAEGHWSSNFDFVADNVNLVVSGLDLNINNQGLNFVEVLRTSEDLDAYVRAEIAKNSDGFLFGIAKIMQISTFKYVKVPLTCTEL